MFVEIYEYFQLEISIKNQSCLELSNSVKSNLITASQLI